MKTKTIKFAVIFLSMLMLSAGVGFAGQSEKKQTIRKTAVSSATGRDVYAVKITKKTHKTKTNRARKTTGYPYRQFTFHNTSHSDRLMSAIQGRNAFGGTDMLLSRQWVASWKSMQADGLHPEYPKSTILQSKKEETNAVSGNDLSLTNNNAQALVFAPYKYQTRFTDGLISLSVPIPATDNLTIEPVISYLLYANNTGKSDSKNWTSGKDSEIVYGGINLIYCF